MSGAHDGLRRLRAAADDGSIAALCAEQDVSLLVVFGSVLVPAAEPHDLDLAVRFDRYAPDKVLPTLDALAELAGTGVVDLLVLNTAGPVAREQALVFGEPLFQRLPTEFAEGQVAATLERLDTDHFRRLQLSMLRSGEA